MKLTVIIPVYNAEDTIEECLRSLLGQERATLGEDYSILVVDDGSTDGTARLARKYPVEILSFPENRGRIVARLAGAKHAQTTGFSSWMRGFASRAIRSPSWKHSRSTGP